MMVDLDLSSLNVAVIGAGAVAARKVAKFDALPRRLFIVSPEISRELLFQVGRLLEDYDPEVIKGVDAIGCADQILLLIQGNLEDNSKDIELRFGPIEIRLGEYNEGDLDGIDYVVVCTDKHELNDSITKAALSGKVLVNNASDFRSSNVRNVAVRALENFSVGVSSHRPVPAVSDWVCDGLVRSMDPSLDKFIEACASIRETLKMEKVSLSRGAWSRVLESGAFDFMKMGETDLAISEIYKCLS